MIKITIEVNKFPENFTGIAEYSDGSKEWCKNGLPHRIDGPAIEYADGSKYWYKNGQLHRIDGPAIEYKSGNKVWYIDGISYTEGEFNKKINNCEGKVIEIEGKKYKLTLTK